MKSEQEMQHEIHIESIRIGAEVNGRLFNSAIEYGVTAIKIATLANGGAAIALLTFLGNLGSGEFQPNAAVPFGRALLFFGFGVSAGGLAAAIAYATQIWYLERLNTKGVVDVHSKLRLSVEIAMALLFLSAFCLFGLGVWQSFKAIF